MGSPVGCSCSCSYTWCMVFLVKGSSRKNIQHFTKKGCSRNFLSQYPTPRIALSVRSFVRSSVTKFQPHHRYMHHRYVHVSGSGIRIRNMCIIHLCIIQGSYIHASYIHASYIHASNVHASGSRVKD